ncbi:MAG: lipopolysaccharide biosynthesis protein [Sphingobium sp.]|nr:lipopolysaccharide biosynthesis protein [Sphingobium sp.]
MKNLSSRIGKGSLWISLTRATVNLLGLVSTVVLARLLVPEDFGLVAVGLTLLAIVTAVTDVAMAQALIHHPDPTLEHMHTAWTLNVARGFLVGGVFAASGPLVVAIYDDPRMLGVMLTLGLGIILSGFANPRRVLLQRQLIFWQDFVLVASHKLVTVVASIIIAFIYHSYWALLLGTLIGQIAQVIVSYTVLPFVPRFSLKHGRQMWSFSMWLTLANILKTVNMRIDQLLIGKIFGPTQLGHFTMGENLAIMPSRETTQPLIGTLFPAFSQLRGDFPRLRRAYQRAQALITAVALPLGVGFALVAEPLVHMAMGEVWLPAVPIIQTLAVVFALQTLASIAYSLAMSFGKTELLFRREWQMLLIRLPILFVLMYFYGLVGVLIARATTIFVTIFFNMQIVKNLINISYWDQFSSNIRSLLGVLIMSGVVLSISPILHRIGLVGDLWKIVIYVVVGAIAYIATNFILWLLAGRPDGPEQDIMRLSHKIISKISS